MTAQRGPYKKKQPKRNCNLHVRVTQDCMTNLNRIIETNPKYESQADLIEDCINRAAHLENYRLQQLQNLSDSLRHTIDESGNVDYDKRKFVKIRIPRWVHEFILDVKHNWKHGKARPK